MCIFVKQDSGYFIPVYFEVLNTFSDIGSSALGTLLTLERQSVTLGIPCMLTHLLHFFFSFLGRETELRGRRNVGSKWTDGR